MSAKTDTAKKRANGHRSRKGTNGKVINAKHNDRNFDVSKADHINENLIDKNVVWKYVDVNEGGEKEEEKKAAEEQKSESELRETLDDYEEKVYEKYFSKALENRNEKQIKARHKDRVQTMEQYRLNAKFCPEESIWTIGNRDNRIEPELLQTIWEEFTAWHKETYPNVLMLDATLHLDEPNAAPHIHRRDVWRYEVDGHWEISQKEALKAMGIERPDLSKKESKYNNAKMTYTAQTRAKWIEIAERHGIEIEKEPQEKSRSGLTMLQLKKRTLEEQIAKFENDIAVLDSQYENKTERDENLDKEIAEKEKQLSQKTAELDGINAHIEELKEQEKESEQTLEENEELRRFVQSEIKKEESKLAGIQEQIQTAKSELVAAVEIPPRLTIPPPPEEPKQPMYTSQHKEYKQQLKQYEKDMKVYQSKTLPQATAAQAEWDSKYNLLKQVQDVHEEQQRTAEQQSQRAAIQEQNSQKLKKERAELEQEKRTLPQKAQAMAMDILRKMERFTELTKINAAWKQRYEQIFGKQYEERIDNNDRTTSQTEQNIYR